MIRQEPEPKTSALESGFARTYLDQVRNDLPAYGRVVGAPFCGKTEAEVVYATAQPAAVRRVLRSNLCQPLSPRRKRQVPFARAQKITGR
jgi:hypothetical protein